MYHPSRWATLRGKCCSSVYGASMSGNKPATIPSTSKPAIVCVPEPGVPESESETHGKHGKPPDARAPVAIATADATVAADIAMCVLPVILLPLAIGAAFTLSTVKGRLLRPVPYHRGHKV